MQPGQEGPWSAAWERLGRYTEPSPGVTYGFAVLVVGVAIAGRWALELVVPGVVPFATLFPAVLAAALVGGAGPGLLAVLLGGLAAELLLLRTSGPILLDAPARLASFALYLLSCALIVAVAVALRWALARIRDERERLRTAQAIGGIGVWEWEIATGRCWWSESLRRILGVGPDVTPSIEAFTALIHAEDRAAAHAALRQAIQTARPLATEFRIRLADGSLRWLASRAEVRVDPKGEARSLIGVNIDLTAHKRAQEHQRLLLQELSHRVKNTLAVVQGIAARSLSGERSLEQAREVFAKRLRALGNAHSLLTARAWEGASLRAVLEAELKPYGQRARLAGPEVALTPEATLSLALMVHELATNALKHGALAAPTGRLAVTWSLDEGPEGPRLRLRWREIAGPPVVEPRTRGFGRTLIEQGLRHELGGEVRMAFRPDGLVCELEMPLEAATPCTSPGPGPAPRTAARPELARPPAAPEEQP